MKIVFILLLEFVAFLAVGAAEERNDVEPVLKELGCYMCE